MLATVFVYFMVEQKPARNNRGAPLQWMVHTYAPVSFPEGCRLVADDRRNENAVLPILKDLAVRVGMEGDLFELRKHETGKPYGVIGDRTIGVSISHCRSMLLCGLYAGGEIGIDVEPDKRRVHPRLLKRICHPEEQTGLPDDLCCIRMWTVKEAALKYLGTGLRVAMNKIRLEMTGEHQFMAFLDPEYVSGSIPISSFPFREHWIAVATGAGEMSRDGQKPLAKT